MEEYIFRLQGWRDRFERTLDSRPTSQALDTLSHYLTEFQYGKVDEIEVPGQYSEVSLVLVEYRGVLSVFRIGTTTKTS